jgi:voltage-gated potassium channel
MTMFGLLRALATAIVLVALYYLLPLDRVKNVPAVLVAGVLILAAVTVAQLRRVVTSSHPTVRAVFSTVGFGDIVAVDQTARVVVTVQMLLDLLFLGLVVRSFAGAVQRTRMAASASVAGMRLAHARQPDEEPPG